MRVILLPDEVGSEQEIEEEFDQLEDRKDDIETLIRNGGYAVSNVEVRWDAL